MRRFFPLIFIFSILTLLCIKAISATEDPFFVQHYDNRNGLSNSSINKLFNDKDNMLWVATWDGLNMYDGSTFHVFNYSKENDFKSIGSNVIQNITEDKRDNIWISTIEGISRYEKRTGRFSNYFYNQYQRSKVSEREYAIAVDTSGTVYCLSQKSGLSYYDAKEDSFRIIKLSQHNSKISKIAFDKDNHLWVLNSNGQLDLFTANKKSFSLAYTFQEKKNINNFFVVENEVFLLLQMINYLQ